MLAGESAIHLAHFSPPLHHIPEWRDGGAMRAVGQERKWLHFRQILNEKRSALHAFSDPSARRDNNWQRATKVIKCADLAHAHGAKSEEAVLWMASRRNDDD